MLGALWLAVAVWAGAAGCMLTFELRSAETSLGKILAWAGTCTAVIIPYVAMRG